MSAKAYSSVFLDKNSNDTTLYTCTLTRKKFAKGGLSMKQNAYLPEVRVATPISISIFDSYDFNLVMISSLTSLS